MNEARIREFWNRNPCGELLVGGIEKHRGDLEAFFTEYDHFRYSTESHIPGCLDRIGFAGRGVISPCASRITYRACTSIEVSKNKLPPSSRPSFSITV